MSNKKELLELWPELEWISNPDLQQQTADTWELALSKSVLSADDLRRIPFTLLCGPDLQVSFMDHKRAVVHIARESGLKMNEFFREELPVNMDVLIAGAILADVGKLLESPEKLLESVCPDSVPVPVSLGERVGLVLSSGSTVTKTVAVVSFPLESTIVY